MKRYKVMLVIFVFTALVLPSAAYPQAMSEINVDGFEKKAESGSTGMVKSPFTPAQPSPRDMLVEDLYLTGIAIGAGKSYALVSGHILTEGDSIAGLRVKSITKGKVVLQHLDKVHTLYLEGGL